MSRKPELRGRAARLARLLPAGGGQAARTPFVLLVVLLLGGGLIGLLVLNSALSEGSFHLDDLQRDTKSLTDEEQALQRDVDTYSAPDALQRRARELGMVPGGDPAFLNPDGSVKGVPGTAAQQSSARNPVVRPPEVLALTQTTAPATSSPSAAVPSAGTATPRTPAPQTSTPRTPTPRTPAPTPSAQPSSTPGR
ncbi:MULTISPECIES: septum formation initiator family protein [Streptomyces]|uniref:Septum formation initiator family protein n=1 Tax=Streptomyces mirabilis TaxID=68239 RepID=A0ABU3UVS9_9ACTN|nr:MULTISPECIES: septum formation initiator family protein [Streptomyces]MCX4608122.1 septum formation initiator family protein [Streptomyces mirabilis]MCX5348587.1 septum formation initiator family protein [Streptomyces mirabilis]MDU8998012.1 septum formation initiator family protein [Streptomyces mirabilis]QDN87165.1 septum formation initiator family protein [Streptomyces sp. RLB3-6]QDO07978.1 septum formation initiator family protein [Streptomyces sp. S1D4-23]